MESDRCRLVRVNFLGAMEADLGAQQNNNKNERGGRKGSKKVCGGKMNSCAGIYRTQNICRFAAVKGSLQRQRVSMQHHRDLRCCVPEGGKKATQRRRTLRRCGPERHIAKMFCLLRSDVEFYTVAYWKVWIRFF